MDYALVLSRVLHITATILVAGVVVFRALVADPGPSGDVQDGIRRQGLCSFDRQLKRIFWISLSLAFVSGAAWLLAVSAAIDDGPWSGVLADGTASTVLTGTQFGQTWIVRLVAGLGLAAAAGLVRLHGTWRRSVAVLLAGVFAGGLAFAGHAASGTGLRGDVHLVSDVLHLLAVSAWLGGLVPFALYLRAIEVDGAPEAALAVRARTERFSNLGTAAVLTIAATGIVNTLNLVGSPELLTHTDYGRLLAIKVGLFIAMVAVAAINRFDLAPRLPHRGTIRDIRRNCLLEVSLGLAVLCIVAALGTMPPALFDHAGMQH
jgi:putative copper resistance protein D